MPKPAVFYFALSAEESLSQDPYNQPVKMLEEKGIKVFSSTLPFHGPGFDNKEAMKRWAEELNQHRNPFPAFIAETRKKIDELIQTKVIDPHHIAVMGLSRGAFAALHLAAHEPRIHTCLGFAPLITLSNLHEFHGENPLIHALSLDNVAHALIGKKIRLYIGNRDERVKTATCFNFVDHLADLNWHAGHRSPPVELMVYPSIGHKGHGTPPEIFQDGVNWLTNKLNI